MQTKSTKIKLHIPVTSLEKLSFCEESSVQGVTEWLKGIHLANINEASKDLYKAIQEITLWNTTSTLRFEVLELIRPHIYSVCNQLSKLFLTNSTTLNAKQTKALTLAQSLLNNLATGYKMVVAKKASYEKATDKSLNILAQSSYRVVKDTAKIILYSFQVYAAPPRNSWLLINQVFNIAYDHNCHQKSISLDNEAVTCIQEVFLQIHLLGMARPNNISQKDFLPFYQACLTWAKMVHIDDENFGQDAFLLDINSDSTANYIDNIKDQSLLTAPKFIDISSLEQHLTEESEKPGTNNPLINHALSSWTVKWARSFNRKPDTGKLNICIGISSIHYFVNNQQSFQKFMGGRSFIGSQNRNFSEDKSDAIDVWNKITRSSVEIKKASWKNLEEPQQDTSIYKQESVDIVNTSPNGYCLEWKGNTSAIKVGELLGVKEERSKSWSIASICWIKNTGASTIQIGVLMLSPKAEAAAVRFIQKVGASGEHVRALLLPEIPILSKPTTLLIPNVGVKPDIKKIDLVLSKTSGIRILKKKVSESNHYIQFELESSNGKKLSSENKPTMNGESDFDAIWNK